MPLLNRQHTRHMRIPQPFPLLTSKQLRSLEHILNLPPIHLMPRQLPHLIIRKPMLPLPTQHQKVIPHMPSRTRTELIILHADMDTRLESGIDIVHAVGGEEENAFIIFKDTEEDGDEFIAFEVVRGALFEEDVGFVEEEDGVPFGGHFEDVAEGGFDFGGGEAEVAGGHHVEGCVHAFRDWYDAGLGMFDTERRWRSMKQAYQILRSMSCRLQEDLKAT